MNLESTVYDTVTEAINAPVISKFILGVTEHESGLTKKELKELSKILPLKLKHYKQSDVMIALKDIILRPGENLKSSKTVLHQSIIDEVNNVIT